MKTIKTVNKDGWKNPSVWAQVPTEFRKSFEENFNVSSNPLFLEERRPILMSPSIVEAVKTYAEAGQVPASEVWKCGRDYESRVLKLRAVGAKVETRLTFRLATGGGERGEDWTLVRVQKGYPCR